METHRLTGDTSQTIIDFIDRGTAFALATVLKDTGSTPQKAGAKTIVDSAGSIWGTIGGGAVEARTIELAVEAIRSMQPVVFDFEFAGTSAEDGPPICGGSMRVVIDPAVARDRTAYAAAAEAHRRRERGALVTTVRPTAPPQVSVRWFSADKVPADAAFPGARAINSALARETPAHFVEDPPQGGVAVEALVEPVVPMPQLFIVGGGHVGQALAVQAGLVGFQIAVIEDRPEFTQPDLFPRGVTTHCGDIVDVLNGLTIDRDTYIVLVTRGHQHDADALAACIRKPATYIGMIGSRRKVAMVREAFTSSGLATGAEFDRVHAPIGLDIGAQTVPEIATSIVAELVAVRRTGGSPQSCRRSKPQ
jgi:xanthine dehydrogenase accessory factor